MENKQSIPLPTITAALIKVAGVFSYSLKDIPTFRKFGYMPLTITQRPSSSAEEEEEEADKKFIRDTYYTEFASLFFPDKNSKYVPLGVSKELDLVFIKSKTRENAEITLNARIRSF